MKLFSLGLLFHLDCSDFVEQLKCSETSHPVFTTQWHVCVHMKKKPKQTLVNMVTSLKSFQRPPAVSLYCGCSHFVQSWGMYKVEVLIAESCVDSYQNMASAERGAAGHRFQVCLMGGCCWSTRWHVKTVLLSKEQHLNTVVLLWTGPKSCIIWKRKTKEEQFQIGARSCLKLPFFLQCKICVSYGRSEEEPFSLTSGSYLVASFFLILCWV